MSSSVSFLETARKDGSSEASSACDFGDFGRFFLFFVTLVYSLSDGSSASSPQRLRVLSVTGANAEKSRILVSNVRTAKACLNSKKHYSCHYSPTWIPYAAVDSYSSDTPPSPWTPPTDSVIGTGARRSPPEPASHDSARSAIGRRKVPKEKKKKEKKIPWISCVGSVAPVTPNTVKTYAARRIYRCNEWNRAEYHLYVAVPSCAFEGLIQIW